MIPRVLLAAMLVLGAKSAPVPSGTNTSHPWPWHRAEAVRVVVGGGGASSIWRPGSAILEMYRGFAPGQVKVITAAGTNCESSGTSLVNSMANAGIIAEWIPICDNYCDTAAYDPAIVEMVDRADAIFYGGGQSGRLQSCLYGDYSQSGIDVEEGATTPVLEALIRKEIVGGSSAGAMNQPCSEILVTGHSVESYSAVSAGSVFQRNMGNRMLETQELVDSHFSERGRQGRLMLMAMHTGQRWAFGVDEDASYQWRPDGVYEIVGEAMRDGIRGGVVIFKDTIGTPAVQSAMVHFLTQGDTINPSTGEIVWAADKQPCATVGLPNPSNSIFDGSPTVPWRTISIAMARQLGTGRVVRNFHGNPPVEVSFTRLGTTVAMCGEDASGPTISFANLLVEQYQGVSQERGAFSNTHAPQYPLNHTWLEDPH
jgi:cyanophycinase-like exopeptidase|eukprot:COSAG01_NODE_1606_length_9753_cov_4.191714_5_plen_427_part_00